MVSWERLSSKDNVEVKRAGKLAASKRARDEAGAFFCEGARLVSDGLASGLRPVPLFVTERALERYPEIVAGAEAAGKAFIITEALASHLSDTETPQGVFAVFEKLDIRGTGGTIYSGRESRVILSQVQDPANVGAVMRSCEAFSVAELILSAGCADVYSPKALRASMGGVFRLPVRVCGDVEREIANLREEGFTVLAAAADGNAIPINGYNFPDKSAIVIGNEGNGLEQPVMKACDGILTIPMTGRAESLNVAVAAGILIWEMQNRKVCAMEA